jgi:hypothetical protein
MAQRRAAALLTAADRMVEDRMVAADRTAAVSTASP